jgi:inorganic triphosphatase YgiF
MAVNETETEDDAPAGARLPGLERLPLVAATSGPEERRLEAEYYDTDGLRLIRAGITLRRRSGGGDDGWYLKLPLGGDTRRAIRRSLGGPERRVPEDLASLVRVQTRGAPLKPIARMTTTRYRLVLLDAAGKSLAEVVADDVYAQILGPVTAVSRWQEVEVELTGGDRRLLRAAGELLRHDGLRRAGQAARLARALGDRLPGPDHVARLTASSAAGQVVLAYLRAHTERLKALDPMVRLDEPDSVHQMRVASRGAAGPPAGGPADAPGLARAPRPGTGRGAA